MIRLLLALYPREWRRRYAVELTAHFGCDRLRTRDAVDLLAGALDAHLHPQWPAPRSRWPLRTVALLAAATVVVGAAARAPAVLAAGGLVAVSGLVLAVARRRWRRRPGWRPDPDDPAAGARVPRRPYDPDPEPLAAAGQLRR